VTLCVGSLTVLRGRSIRLLVGRTWVGARSPSGDSAPTPSAHRSFTSLRTHTFSLLRTQCAFLLEPPTALPLDAALSPPGGSFYFITTF